MTADEWETSNDALQMLQAVRGGWRDQDGLRRRLRRYYLACCRAVWQFVPLGWRHMVEVAEQSLEGRASHEDVWKSTWGTEAGLCFEASDPDVGPAAQARAADTLPSTQRRGLLHTEEGRTLGGRELVTRAADLVDFAAFPRLPRNNRSAGYLNNPEEYLAPFLSPDLLRCVFPNPLRPPTMKPGWRTADVVGLALGIDADGAYGRLPLLADALMDAGCDDEQLLAHARADGHVRGCWLVDLILDKG
jgi:hypothetical protein